MTDTEQLQLRVYVAGGSDSTTRAQRATDRLRSAGIVVTSTWLDVIATVGASNPRDASEGRRFEWSKVDLEQVAVADVVWFLVPSPGVTRGAWVELGVAYTLGKTIVCSGDSRQSIFCALGHEFGDDDAALDFVVKYAGCRRMVADARDPDPARLALSLFDSEPPSASSPAAEEGPLPRAGRGFETAGTTSMAGAARGEQEHPTALAPLAGEACRPASYLETCSCGECVRNRMAQGDSGTADFIAGTTAPAGAGPGPATISSVERGLAELRDAAICERWSSEPALGADRHDGHLGFCPARHRPVTFLDEAFDHGGEG